MYLLCPFGRQLNCGPSRQVLAARISMPTAWHPRVQSYRKNGDKRVMAAVFTATDFMHPLDMSARQQLERIHGRLLLGSSNHHRFQR